MDDSLGFGVLGKRGAGLADHFGVNVRDIDVITASMANALASAGGFCVGSKEVVDHQVRFKHPDVSMTFGSDYRVQGTVFLLHCPLYWL